jgi:DNA primase
VGSRWKDYSYLSLGGTAPLALVQYLKDHPAVSHVYLFLDNDKAGMEGMARAQQVIQADEKLNRQVVELGMFPPRHGKDYNEQLLHLRHQHQEKNTPQRQAVVR